MYQTDNTKIGKYLAELVQRRAFKSDRQFCREYLVKRYGNPDPSDEEIQNMANRFSQIKSGKKGVQIEDLPVFAELLGVSIEDILSGGTALVPASGRQTNYSVAFSRDPAVWEEYVQREDRLILNPDEYDKTAIDYALEAGNYPFLRYLMDKGYIWFVGPDKKEYAVGFGAGTSIKRRSPRLYDILDSRLKEQDDLRFEMIVLALREKDLAMLDRLRARELPLLYTVTPLSHRMLVDLRLPESDRKDRMIRGIAESKVLDYFFEEFEVENSMTGARNSFVFPYAGQVLDALITKKADVCPKYLGAAIAHNRKVMHRLSELIDRSETGCRALLDDNSGSNTGCYDDAYFRRGVWQDYFFYRETGFVAYHMPFYIADTTGFITNVIRVTAVSKNPEVRRLIDELNGTYEAFEKLWKKKEA